jgi:hypothetical protein
MDDTRRTHPTDVAHLRRIAQAIPDTTPPARLRQLRMRYEDERDPLIAALPAPYRGAVECRLRALLAAAALVEPEGTH